MLVLGVICNVGASTQQKKIETKQAEKKSMADVNEQLHSAIQANRAEDVEKILKQSGVNVNNNFGPLVTAAEVGNEKIINLLLQQKDIDINQKNTAGQSVFVVLIEGAIEEESKDAPYAKYSHVKPAEETARKKHVAQRLIFTKLLRQLSRENIEKMAQDPAIRPKLEKSPGSMIIFQGVAAEKGATVF
jgi:hypothetical protein